MTGPMLIVFGILAVAIGLFAWGRPRVDIVAILVVLALILSRVLTPREALAGFGDPVVVLIAAIFIVGEGLVNTGVVHRLGEAVMKLGGGNETRLIVLIMMLAGAVGAFMSSSAIVAMFIPLVLTVASKTGLNSKRMLMPLSVAALISGMMTLIASSPNMIVESTLRGHDLAPLDFFSWTPFGLAVLAAAIAFMLAARDLLSKQLVARDAAASAPSARDLVASYGLTERWHRLHIQASSSLIGRSVAQMKRLYDDSVPSSLVLRNVRMANRNSRPRCRSPCSRLKTPFLSSPTRNRRDNLSKPFGSWNCPTSMSILAPKRCKSSVRRNSCWRRSRH
jgi:di/tricarboxylate transporter